MIWTVEKLAQFKEHFALTNADVARGVGLSPSTIWKMANGVGECPVGSISNRMTGYMEAVKEGKIREMEKMIEFFKAFD